MNTELPIHLYKANVELQLQITRLLQESSQHWLEALQQLSTGSVLETTSRIQGLQQAADWQSLATLPSAVFGRLCQGRLDDAHAVGRVAAKTQAAFANGLREALTTWQESVSRACVTSSEAGSFTQLCQHWAQPWNAASATTQGNAKR